MAALGLGLWSAQRTVQRAADDLLLEEAAMAVELWSLGGAGALDAFAPGRWRVDEAEAAGPVATAPHRTGRGRVEASVYDADGWNVVGTLALQEPAGRRDGMPWSLYLVALSTLVALVAGVGWWVEDLGPGRAAGPPAVALALLITLSSGGRWAHTELTRLTDHRMEAAAGALEIGYGGGGAWDVPADPGALARLTGVATLRLDARGRPSTTTLLPGEAEALAGLSAPPPPRATVAGTPRAVRDTGPYRLAAVPWEHTHNPWPLLMAILLAALAGAAAIASLAPLARRPRALRRNLWAWSFLAPATAHLLVFTVGPLVFAAWLSLHRWSLLDEARPFVGLGNYAALAADGSFWNAVGNTALFTLHVPVAMAVALAFALLVHRRTRFTLAVRTALFLPSITSLVAIAIVWKWILNDDYGVLNWVLGWVGVEPVRWLTSPRTALLSIMLLSTWMVVGYQMVLFQAGLAAIPRELYEAARIDGAGPLQRFRHVTLPGLRHTLFFVLVTSVIGSFQIFGAVYVMTEGGPLGATDVAVYHIYKEAWEFLRFGSAAAQSWVLFAIIFVVTWLHFRFLEQRSADARPGSAPAEGVAGDVAGGGRAGVSGVPASHGVAP